VCQCRPASRGSVQIRSADPFDQPRIEPRYFSEPLDRETMVSGLQWLRDIYAQPAFRDLWDLETMPGPGVATRAQLWDFARSRGGTVFHPVGTCRMGSDEQAVLDPELRVRGVQGLRVVDASVMPTLISANTNAASIMVGERGADFLLGA
jgi:choline dehydrogenase